jgi:thiol:disulfide interchange protein DsbD
VTIRTTTRPTRSSRTEPQRRSWSAPAALTGAVVFAAMMLLPALALAEPSAGSDTGAFTRYAGQSFFIALGASYVFGIVSSLTPCVFPMIPITVAIFGATDAKSKVRAAGLSGTFVLGIAILFTGLGLAAATSGSLLGAALQQKWVLISIALVFAALASSMFGAFEMALPSGLNNKLSTVGGVGYKGALVLGLVMGLVAMPCTGPFITGMVLWIASTKNVALGGACMFVFALGLGTPFFLAGAFAAKLPKTGAWMLGIKWASGVGLSYFALSYLRDAFPVLEKLAQPGTIYGVVAGTVLMAGFILGVVHIAAERRKSSIAHLSKPMKLASILPAVAGAFMFFTWFQMAKSPVVSEAIAAEKSQGAGAVAAKPIVWLAKEADAIAQAATEKKPLIIDFGASWCKACKELEEQTFPDARVRGEAQRFVALRVDASDDDSPEVKQLQAKYKVVGLPTVVILDSAGKESARFNEFAPPDRFAAALKSVN